MSELQNTIRVQIRRKVCFQDQQVEGQPDKTPRKNGDNSAVVLLKNSRLLGCVFQDTQPPKSSSILQRGTQTLEPTRKVKFSPNALRHIKIREKKGRSLGVIQRTFPHERSPYAPKFEERLQEATEMQERCARGDAWRVAKSIMKLKDRDKASSFSPTEICFKPVPSLTNPE